MTTNDPTIPVEAIETFRPQPGYRLTGSSLIGAGCSIRGRGFGRGASDFWQRDLAAGGANHRSRWTPNCRTSCTEG